MLCLYSARTKAIDTNDKCQHLHLQSTTKTQTTFFLENVSFAGNLRTIYLFSSLFNVLGFIAVFILKTFLLSGCCVMDSKSSTTSVNISLNSGSYHKLMQMIVLRWQKILISNIGQRRNLKILLFKELNQPIDYTPKYTFKC